MAEWSAGNSYIDDAVARAFIYSRQQFQLLCHFRVCTHCVRRAHALFTSFTVFRSIAVETLAYAPYRRRIVLFGRANATRRRKRDTRVYVPFIR